MLIKRTRIIPHSTCSHIKREIVTRDHDGRDSSQDENEKDVYIAGVYTSDCHASLSVNMISYLLFINRNSRVTPPEKYIDVFEVSNSIYNIKPMIWIAMLTASINQNLRTKKINNT